MFFACYKEMARPLETTSDGSIFGRGFNRDVLRNCRFGEAVVD
jgi:hypothetical protein